jgi:hypothetical protein
MQSSIRIIGPSTGSLVAAASTALRNATGATAPPSPSVGDVWIDTSSVPIGSGARVRKNAAGNQTIASATHVAVTMDFEDFDDAAFHDTGANTSRLTIPTGGAGRYEIGGQVEFAWATAGTPYQATIWLNGVGTGTRLGQNTVTSSTVNTISPRLQVVSGLVVLADGDYVELSAWQQSGSNGSVTHGAPQATFVTIRRVG